MTWESWSQGGMALVDGHWRHAVAIARNAGPGDPLVRVRIVEDLGMPDMQTYARELHSPAREVVIPLVAFASDGPAET